MGEKAADLAHRLRLSLFGYPSVALDDVPLDLGERRALALVVYLATAGGPVSRETASTLLWPEADVDTSRVRLRRLLYKIRKAAGVGIVQGDRSNIWISPLMSVESDVRLFEELLSARRLAEAEPLYTQDFLDGFHLDEASDIEEWIFFRREALRSRLLQALERLVQHAFDEGRHADAAQFAVRLVECDPMNEAAHRHLIRAAVEGGDLVSARRHYQFCADLLQRSLGVQPSKETRALLQSVATAATQQIPFSISPVHYVAVDGVHVAYRTVGEGDVDILLVPGFVSHVERGLDDRRSRRWIEQVSSHCRLIVFDRRGVGLSDRLNADPTPEAVARDMEAVLNAVGSQKAVIIGASEGGPGSIFFASRFAQRVHKLILWGAMAKGCKSGDYPFALDRQQFDAWLAKLTREWGGAVDLTTFAPSLLDDPAAQNWWASLLRASSSPGSMRAVLSALRDVDVRQLLPGLAVPTTLMHRKGDRAVLKEASIYMAEQIPDARLVLLEGKDHWFWVGDYDPLIREIAATVRGVEQEKRSSRAAE